MQWLCSERLVNELLEPKCSFIELAVSGRLLLTCTEILIGDVQRHQDGQSEHVAGRGAVGGGAHLLVDVRCEFGDVAGIEPAANGVALSRDFNGDDAVHYIDSS